MSDDTTSLDAKFRQALQHDDELGSVVRAHLHVEHLVDKLLEHLFPNAEALGRLQLEYSDKVTLLDAFGYLSSMTNPLAAIGKLRNDFAHKLDFVLTADRMDALYELFDPEGKQIVQSSYQRTRRQMNSDAPKKMANLSPKDRFVMYASTIRTMLVVAYRHEVEGHPGAEPRG